MSYKALQFCVAGLVKYSGANRRKTGSRFNIQVDHGFRKRFNTILKLNSNVNPNIAEKLLGHKGIFLLDGSYLTPTKEQCFAEFSKAISDLTIDDSERQKIKIEKLEAKTSEIEKLKEDFKKDHEIVMELEKANEWAQYLYNKLRGQATKADDERFKEKYPQPTEPTSSEEPEWIRSNPQIQTQLKRIISTMMKS